MHLRKTFDWVLVAFMHDRTLFRKLEGVLNENENEKVINTTKIIKFEIKNSTYE